MRTGILNGNISLESANQIQPREGVSSRYSFIPTTTILNTLRKEGWIPFRAQEVGARKNIGFQKHLIRLQKEEYNSSSSDIIPEIILTNSHNTTASFTIMAGIFRAVCLNGLIVADSTFASHKICHKGYTEDKVLDAIYSISESAPKISSKIEEFKEIALTSNERLAFADSALSLKFDEKKLKKIHKNAILPRLLDPRRSEDSEPNLWNTYNIIQEKFIKGDRYLRLKEKQRIRKQRPINSINENIRLNKALWTLTEKMAEL